MTDDVSRDQRIAELRRIHEEREAAKPRSVRSGTLKEIAEAACERTKGSHHDSFAIYLKNLKDDQSSIYQKKRPRQETLNQQMDMLDAMFTYLAVHADWKDESQLSYSAALRSQKQFCSTLKDLKNLQLPKAPATPSSPPVIHR